MGDAQSRETARLVRAHLRTSAVWALLCLGAGVGVQRHLEDTGLRLDAHARSWDGLFGIYRCTWDS